MNKFLGKICYTFLSSFHDEDKQSRSMEVGACESIHFIIC